LIMIVEIYRRLAMVFNGARCRWAAYVRARSALIIGARGHAKARRHGGDEPSAFRTPAAGRVLPSDPAQTRRKEQAGVGYWMPAAAGNRRSQPAASRNGAKVIAVWIARA
jgi:hypothetical protein